MLGKRISDYLSIYRRKFLTQNLVVFTPLTGGLVFSFTCSIAYKQFLRAWLCTHSQSRENNLQAIQNLFRTDNEPVARRAERQSLSYSANHAVKWHVHNKSFNIKLDCNLPYVANITYRSIKSIDLWQAEWTLSPHIEIIQLSQQTAVILTRGCQCINPLFT